MDHKERVLIAAVISPAVPALIAAPLIVVYGGGLVNSFIQFAGLCYVVAIFLGLPAFLLLNRFDWVSWWQLATAGALIGALVSMPQLASAIYGRATASELTAFLPVIFYGTCIGLVIGLSFWAIGRPDSNAL